MIKVSLQSALVLAIVVVFSATAVAATIPIVEFTFDGNLNNTGSAGGVGSWVTGNGATPTYALNAGTEGTGDTVMDNTSANNMGSLATTGGWMDIADTGTNSIGNALDGLQAFTLTAWIKSSVLPGNAARLVTKRHTGGTTSFGTYFTAGKLGLVVDNITAVSSTADWTAVDTWQFVAVAYDGTSTSDNVRFYSGTAGSTTLNPAGVASLNAGTLGSNDNPLRIGNLVEQFERPFNGLLDDIRIYGSTADATGALSEAEIGTIFLADHPIPEPSTLVLLAAGGLAAAVCLLRRRVR